VRRRVVPGILLAVLLASLLLPPVVAADGGPRITSQTARADFPTGVSFNVSVESGATITDVRLRYRVDRQSFAEVTSEMLADFTPGNRVSATAELDLRLTGGFPPGTELDYWWAISDSSGAAIVTAPSTLRLDDDRFGWQSRTRGLVTLHWYQGDRAFADSLLGVAEDALERLAGETGASLQRPADIYIYNGQRDLLDAMVFPQEWTGGVAYPAYSAIAIGITESNMEWGLSAVAHELAHLVVHQITDNPYLDIPVWLDEGLAVSAQPTVSGSYTLALEWAAENDLLFSVRSLCSPFSAYSEKAILSYAQSWSLVQYLTATYGQGEMLRLLETFREGCDYNEALERVYGFDIEGLDSLWRAYAAEKYG